jgi:catechol 2,3-dioxygenase-like lactoylglutathione lyase family enzyme
MEEKTMLASSKMIGFVLTRDAQRARKFYEQALGFRFVSEDQFALVLKTDENMIRISPVKDSTPAAHTILGWEVADIEREVGHLRERGVEFTVYPWMKASGSVIWSAPGGDKVAWFQDPDGNVLSLSQHKLAHLSVEKTLD